MALLRPSHPETFPESAIQVCLTLKVLFGLPLRQTAGLVASPAAIARNEIQRNPAKPSEILRATHHPGRARWTRWARHVRSRIKARMNGRKAFGGRIMSRDPDRQRAEIRIRIAIMNHFNTFAAAGIKAVA